nr:MAG TPA: hypothetical protein [Caudoviricetes sp.]
MKIPPFLPCISKIKAKIGEYLCFSLQISIRLIHLSIFK